MPKMEVTKSETIQNDVNSLQLFKTIDVTPEMPGNGPDIAKK